MRDMRCSDRNIRDNQSYHGVVVTPKAPFSRQHFVSSLCTTYTSMTLINGLWAHVANAVSLAAKETYIAVASEYLVACSQTHGPNPRSRVSPWRQQRPDHRQASGMLSSATIANPVLEQVRPDRLETLATCGPFLSLSPVVTQTLLAHRTGRGLAVVAGKPT